MNINCIENQSIDPERIFGENLERKLESYGLPIELPSYTDWGYVFRTRFKNHKFDIIISKNESDENSLTITISSTLSKFEKFFCIKDSSEIEELEKIIYEIK